ncbi:hypothetical protein BT63DRAFT_476573 [Microthyrium microscopicum]|uniref:CENP-V/GFA domain-containing protein n=1 Tax=Microthyrium microscopicum TaxID=703497 RepID=A0A6A6UJP5_9PEZI|nr:hypothetical protein BT63DRAFT_476573 [Microthyrium microscopicum]
MTSTSTSTIVTGGCACEKVRYSIVFPAETQWPLENNGTCQCTTCRKWTGALLPQSISVPTASIDPPFSTQPSYTQWASSNSAKRGFCSTCGSSLTFTYDADPDSTEIHVGSIDEHILLGAKNGEEYHGEHGTKATRKDGGIGKLLTRTDRSSNIWWENAIEGVTDDRPGLKFWRERSDGTGFETLEELNLTRSRSK